MWHLSCSNNVVCQVKHGDICWWSLNNILWHHLTFSQDAREVTTWSLGLYSKSCHRKKNLKRFPHLLLGDERIELWHLPFLSFRVVGAGGQKEGWWERSSCNCRESIRFDSRLWGCPAGSFWEVKLPVPVSSILQHEIIASLPFPCLGKLTSYLVSRNIERSDSPGKGPPNCVSCTQQT